MFAGALCYADDIVILAPCTSALRRMLDICSMLAKLSLFVFVPANTVAFYH